MAFLAFLIIAYSLLCAVGLALVWRYRRASPIFWHQAALTLMAIGTFPFIDPRLVSDTVYAWLIFYAHATFVLFAIITVRLAEVKRSFDGFATRADSRPSDDTILLCWIIFIVSVGVTILYYYLVGYNIVFLLLSGSLDVESYSELRLAAYGTGDYFAPGYINQFKNLLLPLTTIILAYNLRERRQMHLFYPFVALATPLLIIALAGTGQRAFIIYTVSAFAFGYFLQRTGRGSSVSVAPILGAVAILLPVFVAMTAVYMGKSDPGEILAATFGRFLSTQQEGGLFAFQYIYPFPTTWFHEWWQNVEGIVPGAEGSRIAHEIHAAMYGSDRGTAPLTSVGSAWYNGWLLGTPALFGTAGVIYTLLYRRFLNGERNYVRSFGYGFAFLYMSIYVVDAPTVLLDNGVLTAFIFLFMVRTIETMQRRPKFQAPELAR